MEISVKNFGPIKHGSIDLSKRFYVFVGHNNSGKTYMANLVWGMNTYGIFNIKADENIIPISHEDEFITLDNDIFRYVTKKLEEKILKEKIPFWFRIDEHDNLLKKLEIKLSENFLKQLFYESSTKLDFDYVVPNNRKLEYGMTILKKKNSLTLEIKRRSRLKDVEDTNSVSYKEYDIGLSRISIYDDNVLTQLLSSAILQPLNSKTILNNTNTFLPANRLFYPSFYRYVYEAAKGDNDKISEEIRKGNPNVEKIKSLSKRPYTKAMDNLLSTIYRLDASVKPNEIYTDLLQKLSKLMGGEIVTKNAEGIGLNEFKLKMDSGEELDLYLSSSAANQLTTLYLYFKYWASDGNNFLIMDEPEENLHPKHQIALLDILMQFANRNNNRVLITTHSSLLAESVNNHIQIGKLQDLGKDVEQIVRENGLDISLNENLRPDNFGVYFFGNQAITPYEVDDYGVFFRDFKQEENKVASTAQVLSEHIYDSLKKDKTVLA